MPSRYHSLWLAVLLLSANPRADGGGPRQWVLPAVQAPGLEYRVFDSQAAGGKVSYQIVLPEIYDREPERRFPVLYWLHGSGGSPATGLLAQARNFREAIRQGKIPPLLVVFPNGLANGMWCDAKDGRTPVETILIQDLLPEVDRNFRTIAAREGRNIEGFSMGGYGAARLGFKHHDLFAAVSLLGAGPMQRVIAPDVGPKMNTGHRVRIFREVFGNDQDYFAAQSPWVLAEQHAAAIRETVRIRLAIGELDETLPANREFVEHLGRLGIPHTFHIVPEVGHKPQPLLLKLGEENWTFYRETLGETAPAGK